MASPDQQESIKREESESIRPSISNVRPLITVSNNS